MIHVKNLIKIVSFGVSPSHSIQFLWFVCFCIWSYVGQSLNHLGCFQLQLFCCCVNTSQVVHVFLLLKKNCEFKMCFWDITSAPPCTSSGRLDLWFDPTNSTKRGIGIEATLIFLLWLNQGPEAPLTGLEKGHWAAQTVHRWSSETCCAAGRWFYLSSHLANKCGGCKVLVSGCFTQTKDMDEYCASQTKAAHH